MSEEQQVLEETKKFIKETGKTVALPVTLILSAAFLLIGWTYTIDVRSVKNEVNIERVDDKVEDNNDMLQKIYDYILKQGG